MSAPINLVEMMFDEQHDSPCVHGNIVDGHACYCHHADGPRKCPIWRNWAESDLKQWNTANCELFSARTKGTP